jgi:hypothetical protein
VLDDKMTDEQIHFEGMAFMERSTYMALKKLYYLHEMGGMCSTIQG